VPTTLKLVNAHRGGCVLTEIVVICAAGASFVSLCLSVTSLLIHYAKRAENPLLTPVYSAIDSLRLSQADLVDKVEHWQKRDRARRLREEVVEPAQMAPDQTLPSPADLKSAVRAAARTRGFVK
jgi:hypothetical protein